MSKHNCTATSGHVTNEHANSCRGKEVASSASLFDTIANTDEQQSIFEMTDIGAKTATKRRALSSGKLFMGDKAFQLLKEGKLPKGDALILAEIAGIQACKKASDTIPLCHPTPLEKIAVSFTLNEEENSVSATCIVSAFASTGVETEALSGVNGAILSLYDSIKDVDAELYISDILLEVKQGGKSGLWIHPQVKEKWANLKLQEEKKVSKNSNPFQGFKVAMITLSDRASKGEYADLSGAEGVRILQNLGAEVSDNILIPDDKIQLEEALNKLTENKNNNNIDMIISTGGTGISKRDITPDVVNAYCERTIIGFGELLRKDGANHTGFSWLSRSVAGIKNQTLIIALPGNPKAVKEGIEALKGLIPHTIRTLQKDTA